MNDSLDTRLARAARGDDLSALLCALERADWALVLGDDAQLLSALARQIGPGTLRADPRLPLDPAGATAAGLELASTGPDWRGAKAVWLVEPDDRTLKRARKADVPVVVDATHCPGGGWLDRGARWVAYRDLSTLTGHGDLRLAVLLGRGERPDLPFAAPSALVSALVTRDLPTLGLRLARQVRSASTLVERLGERASVLAGGVLFVTGELPATQLFDTANVLGGVAAARREVPGGTLLSAGLENVEDLWRDLTGNTALTEEKLADEVTPEMAQAQPVTDDVPEAEPIEGTPGASDEATDEPQPEPAPAVELHLTPDLPSVQSGETADPTADLTDEQHAAFERLREWRNAEARRQEVSRFIVASNATLAEIAREAPQTEAELRRVKGMGPERVRKYAEAILNMVRGMR